MDHPTITITLTLHREDGCLEAVLDDGHGPSRPLHGWIGLMGAIDALLDAEDDRPVAPLAEGEPS